MGVGALKKLIVYVFGLIFTAGDAKSSPGPIDQKEGGSGY